MPKSEAGASHHSAVHPAARTMAALTTAVLETSMAFPLDKYKNVRMANPEPSTSFHDKVGKALAGDAYHKQGYSTNLRVAYRGVVPYGIHKLANRGLKLVLHPIIMEGMMVAPGYKLVENKFGKSKAKIAASATAGALAGAAEVIANPVDRAKVLCQRHNDTFFNVLVKMRKEGMLKQYAGWQPTLARNVIGSGSLFGGKFFGYAMMGVTDHNKTTFLQSFGSSMIGSAICISASHLPDMAKTQAQLDESARPMGSFARLGALVSEKGPTVLLEGYFPKLLSSGMKLAVVVTAYEMLAQSISAMLQPLARPGSQFTLFAPATANNSKHTAVPFSELDSKQSGPAKGN